MRIRTSFPRFAVLVLLLCLPSLLSAQNQASVTGVVMDSSGAVIPNAGVTLSNPSTGLEYNAVTNSAGSYRIANVAPGPGYKLVISSTGFSPYQAENVYLNVGITATQNATLNPGQHVEVTVSALGQGVTLNTEDASIGNNIEVSKLNELPVQSRLNPTVLFTLQPGITLDGAATGGRVDQDNVTVDGLDVNDFATGNFGAITTNAPVDSVQEFRGTTGGFTPNSGPGGGGQFELVTRSGTNNWHGQANIYHRDNSTTANDWFNDLVGIRAPKLVQNQFGGSVGGPIKHDKMFFFFNYTSSRIAQDSSILRTVPLPSFLAGNISYINSNAGCDSSSRQNTAPNCISHLTPAQVQALDPALIGESPALYNILKTDYPVANDVSTGDGINTGGFRFNAPTPTFTNVYVGKLDYNLTSKIHLFGVGGLSRENQVNGANGAAQFPGRPPATQFVDRSYRYLVGMDWQLAANKTNQFTYGTVVQDYSFPRPSNVLGVNQVSFGTGTTTLLDDPFSSPSNAQSRHVPIPQIQDNFSWTLGRHSLSLGGTFKWIHTNESTVLDYNSYGLGLGGEIQGLQSSLRPTNLLPASSTAQVTYDSAFTAALGRVASIATTTNYDASGNPLPGASGSNRSYKYHQVELYALDNWKITPHLTFTYGVNYQYFSVPYETNGLETAQPSVKDGGLTFDKYMTARVAQSSAGDSGPGTVPFITYVLGGPKNHGPGLYNADPLNFAPRASLAWNPKWDPNTVISFGGGLVYDRTIVSAVQYQQDQYSYLFQQNFTQNYGNGTDPVASLRNDPRLDHQPAAPVPATPKPPFQPYIDPDGTPTGLGNGGAFNEMIDPNLKTPYSIIMSANFQHQFPGSTLLRISYAGRLGRRLLAQADANQLVEFPDKTSGQLMSTAMGNVTKELRRGADPKHLPGEGWFENQVPPGLGASILIPGTNEYYPNNTSFLADNLGSLMQKGDFADTIQALAGNGLIDYNVGMGAQFSENSFYTNKGFSSYNGLLVTFQKNLTRGLQFDANYTWSHSIDNVSVTANSPAIGGYGFVCDVLRPRLCRGNSDFDVSNYFTGDFTYALPFGRGRTFGANMPLGLDEVIGGWDISGIPTWHSGIAFSTVSSAFVAGYANDAPGIFNGDTGAIKRKVHKTQDGTLTLFADPTAAKAAFQGPIGFQIGSRNSLRGPQYFNIDFGLAKSFAIWPREGVKLLFRGDAFNVLNHPNFQVPDVPSNFSDFTTSSFGQLTNMTGVPASTGVGPRVLQLSGRIQF